MTIPREQYEQAIRYTALQTTTPIEVVDLIADLFGTPWKIVEADIGRARHTSPSRRVVPQVEQARAAIRRREIEEAPRA